MRRDAHLHIADERLATLAAEMSAKLRVKISRNAIVIVARASHRIDAAIDVFVAVFGKEFSFEVFLGRNPVRTFCESNHSSWTIGADATPSTRTNG